MAKNKLPPGFSRFEFRPGVAGFPSWSGLDLRSDAAASPANTFRVAKNVRLWGQEVIARGGQEKLNSTSIDPVIGIFDTDGEEGGQKLWGFASQFIPDPAYASATWYTQSVPVGDATNGYAYLVAVGTAGGGKTIRIFRITKPVTGEVNLLYIPTRSGDDPFSLIAVGINTGTEVAVSTLGLSYSAGTLTTPVGTAVAEMNGSWLHSATPSLWKVITHYAEGGTVWFSGVETGGTNQRLYKVDTYTNTFTQIGTFPFISGVTSVLRHFHKFGAQLLAIRKTSTIFNHELVKLPSLDTVSLGANFTSTFPNHNQRSSVAVYDGSLYIAGHQVTPDRGALAKVDSSYAVSILERSASTSELTTLAPFGGYLYAATGGGVNFTRWNGSSFTEQGVYGGPGQFTGGMPSYFDPTLERLFATNDAGGVVSILRRSNVADLTTFANYGTQTWTQTTSAPLFNQHAYFSVIP